MRKFIFLTIFAVICVSLSAQKLSVSNFNFCQECVFIDTPPKDTNGEFCSLLIISTPGINAEQRKNIIFEADAATQIVEITYPTAEIRIWLSHSAAVLYIKHDDFGKCDFELPIVIKPKKAYTMDITYTKGGGVEKLMGWLLIDTQPESGADVYLNDEHKGVTPFQQKVEYGIYTIKVEKPFYHATYDRIEVNMENGNKRIVTMKPQHGFIHITTNPSNAEVVIDEMIVLKSPCTTDKLSSGIHNVKVRYDRYKPYNQKVTVVDGETYELNVNLTASFAATTIVNTIGGEIYVDGKKQGSDKVTMELNEGYHDIEARAVSHKSVKQGVTIETGKAQTITLSPTPITGNLDIVSTPYDATITVDGKNCGVTPTTVKNLLIGEHTVTLTLTGYATETRTVTITENVTETLNVKLSSGKNITINSEPIGANVYVDGTYLGTTPLTKQIAFGSHNLKVSLDGEEKSEVINVSEGGKSSWSFDVRKKPKTSIGSLYTFSDGSKGIVFYLDSDGHGLVVSLDETEKEWGGYGTDINRIPNESNFNKNLNIGLGATYTTYIINQLGRGNAPAAEWCRNKGSEWYLPSAGELWQLLAVANEENGSSGPISKALKSNGGTKLDSWYWSSSEYSYGHAWGMNGNGGVGYNYKGLDNRVRAVRAF